MASTRRSFGVPRAKPLISIRLNNEVDACPVQSFTSLDEIKGEVTVVSQTNLPFDDLYITFEGSIRTVVEKIATTSPTNARTGAFHNFLRLVQPTNASGLPHDRVLQANQSYRFAFNFVVPPKLLPQSCTHDGFNSLPPAAHLDLPPSLGDSAVSAVGKSLLDDMASEQSVILYGIKCRLTKGRGSTGKHLIIAEGLKKLRIMPGVEEAPPLHVDGGEKDDYRLRKEMSIRRGLFRKKLGRISAEAPQPKSFRLRSIHSEATEPITTMTAVKIRFDPADERQNPPKLGMMGVKLKVGTFWSSKALQHIPARSSDFHYNNTKALLVDSIGLASRNLGNVEWKKHSMSSGSEATGGSVPGTPEQPEFSAPSTAYKGKTFYTARIIVPVELPEDGKRTIIPTFHSCFVSRIYALDVSISFEPPKATVSDPILILKLPVQVSCEPNPRPSRQTILSPMRARMLATEAEAGMPFDGAPPNIDHSMDPTNAQLAENIVLATHGEGDEALIIERIDGTPNPSSGSLATQTDFTFTMPAGLVSTSGRDRSTSISKSAVTPNGRPRRPRSLLTPKTNKSNGGLGTRTTEGSDGQARVAFAASVSAGPSTAVDSARTSVHRTTPPTRESSAASSRRASQQVVPVQGARQRFQSLAFDDEDMAHIGAAQREVNGDEAILDDDEEDGELDESVSVPNEAAVAEDEIQGTDGATLAPPPAYTDIGGGSVGRTWRNRIITSGAVIGERLRRLSSAHAN